MRVIDGFHYTFESSKILTTQFRFKQVMNICNVHENVVVRNLFPLAARHEAFEIINSGPVPLVERRFELRSTNSF